jgi:hypothetical protein
MASSQSGGMNQDKRQKLLITNVEEKYIKDPVLLKKELDSWSNTTKIKEIKTTAANNLIIVFDSPADCEKLKNDPSIFSTSKKIILSEERNKDRMKQNELEVVIKGMNYNWPKKLKKI